MHARRTTVLALSLSLLAVGCSDGGQKKEPYEAPRVTTGVDLPSGKVGRDLPGRVVQPAKFTAPSRQPNILVFTTDDATLKDLEFMPHVNREIADRGVTLTQAVSPTPICVPSRASFLTGQYSHNHGAVTISGPRGGFDALHDDQTLPVWLQEAGYDTLFVGKYLNGYGEKDQTYVPPGWTDWRATVDPTTYNFFGHTLNTNGSLSTHQGEYSTTLLSEQADEMLADPRRADKPWMMWFNFVAPHHGAPREEHDPEKFSTTVPDPADAGSFADLDLPDTPDMFEKDPSDKEVVGAARRKVDGEERSAMRQMRQQRVEALQSVDRAVDSALDVLRENGQLDNTYIMFTSDNGYVIGEHNMRGKLWYFDDILTVPTVLRGPGIQPGSTSATPVSEADWAPTFAALAGARTPADVDGENVFGQLFTGATQRAIPIAGYAVVNGDRVLYRGVNFGDWTYVRNRRGAQDLYWRTEDPYQLENLAPDERFKPWLKRMRKLERTYRECAGEECHGDFYAPTGSR